MSNARVQCLASAKTTDEGVHGAEATIDKGILGFHYQNLEHSKMEWAYSSDRQRNWAILRTNKIRGFLILKSVSCAHVSECKPPYRLPYRFTGGIKA